MIWLVVLILQFFETQSFTNLRELFTTVIAVHKWFLCFVRTDQQSRATMYGSQKSHNPWLECHENEQKIIYNDDVFRNDHRIKTTQTNFNDLGIILFRRQCFIWWNKICYISSNFKVTKIERSAFMLGHPVQYHPIDKPHAYSFIMGQSTWQIFRGPFFYHGKDFFLSIWVESFSNREALDQACTRSCWWIFGWVSASFALYIFYLYNPVTWQ